ncbi:phage portal protein [Nonomuraea sp. ATR24]|uniref:phage portal protein n=1 Tax=Nonomuraea sp. ATR24 TaxID=1676744 RepID=UPI0035C1953B
MGLIRSHVRAALMAPSGIATPEKWVEEWFAGGSATSAGVWVSEETALHYAPFFAGVRVIAEDVASLPLITYERLARGKRRASEHPLYPLLHDQPNPYMTSVGLRETLQGHALTWGDGYGYIVRNGAGEVTELWPLRPDRCKPEITRTGPGRMTLMYRYTDEVNGIRAMLHPDEVLHVKGLGGDGITGYSVVGMARQSLGLGVAAETYGSKLFSNNARPGGVLKTPGRLSPDANKRLKIDWENMHQGLDQAHRVAILEEGLEWEAIGIPPEDAQFLETRKFQVTEMARWLRLPPHKIGDLERATFSNIEHQQIDYVASALRIWLVRWEQAIFTRLLTSAERGTFFAEHLVDALLRGDIKTRYEAYALGRNWGWLSADDVAEMENMNPLPDGRGEVYLVPLNMKPAPTPKEAAMPPPAPEPPAPPPDDDPPDDDPPDDDPDDDPRGLRRRGSRSIEARRAIAAVYAEQLLAADRELAEREQVTVGRLADALDAGGSTSTFLAELEALYEGEIRQETIDAWMPILAELAAAIAEEAAAEVAHEEPVDLSTWVAAYVAAHVGYRMASQLGQLTALVQLGGDTAAAVRGRLADWVATRPERIARWQAVQLPSAAAREVWREAGVAELRWTTFGAEDCPFCASLDGATVPIDTPFIPAGSTLTEGDSKMKPGRAIHHPPLHPGCDCQVSPV